ncbi:MAG TPA: cobalamin-binding protein [Planctomycetota bacterium]
MVELQGSGEPAGTPGDWPQRVVCLTEETTEVLYRIGAGDRVVGVSGYTVRPREARRKPRISAFVNADFERIVALEPDLVLAFSDLQADIVAELARRGLAVHVFNQRSIAEILQAVRITGALVGRVAEAATLAGTLQRHLDAVAVAARALPRRPRVFFEEWPEPLISGIRWVSELIEIAGGADVCAETRTRHDAAGRTVDPADVARRDPEVVIASWCGRKVAPERIRERSGWSEVAAVRADRLYEIKSSYVLQPGPAALTDGLDQIAAIIAAAARGEDLPPARPGRMRSAGLEPRYK